MYRTHLLGIAIGDTEAILVVVLTIQATPVILATQATPATPATITCSSGSLSSSCTIQGSSNTLKAYELTETGFMIQLDRNLYAREAVMKALYRFHDKYIISYETDGAFIHVFFEAGAEIESIEQEISAIMKELSFQVIRLDTARRTRGIRELLVARSLYASCIEPEREASESEDSEKSQSWRDDQDRIFASWSAEES